MFNLGQDIPLADENDEHEEASQHVAAVDNSEEDLNRLDILTRFSIVVVDDEMDTLNAPKNAKDQEKLEEENLNKCKMSFR